MPDGKTLSDLYLLLGYREMLMWPAHPLLLHELSHKGESIKIQGTPIHTSILTDLPHSVQLVQGKHVGIAGRA